jgi:hypothetical protein
MLNFSKDSQTIKAMQAADLLPQTLNDPIRGLEDLFEVMEKHRDDRTMTIPLGEMDEIAAYILVFRQLVKMAHLPFLVKRVIADVDPGHPGGVILSFYRDDERVEWRFDRDSSSMNETFLTLTLQFTKENSQEIFVSVTPMDYFWKVMSLPASIINLLESEGVAIERI